MVTHLNYQKLAWRDCSLIILVELCAAQHHPVGYQTTAVEFTFFAGNKYLLLGVKLSSKTNITGSKHWWPYKSPLTTYTCSWQIEDQTNSIMVKGIGNAFDQMKWCLVLPAEVILCMKWVSTSQKSVSLQKFQAATFCHLLLQQMANGSLLLATVNFESWTKSLPNWE